MSNFAMKRRKKSQKHVDNLWKSTYTEKELYIIYFVTIISFQNFVLQSKGYNFNQKRFHFYQ